MSGVFTILACYPSFEKKVDFEIIALCVCVCVCVCPVQFLHPKFIFPKLGINLIPLKDISQFSFHTLSNNVADEKNFEVGTTLVPLTFVFRNDARQHIWLIYAAPSNRRP